MFLQFVHIQHLPHLKLECGKATLHVMASGSAKQDQTLTNTQSNATMRGGKQSEPIGVFFKRACGTNTLSPGSGSVEADIPARINRNGIHETA